MNIFLIKQEKITPKLFHTFSFFVEQLIRFRVVNYSRVVYVTLIYIGFRGERNSTYYEQYVHVTLSKKKPLSKVFCLLIKVYY